MMKYRRKSIILGIITFCIVAFIFTISFNIFIRKELEKDTYESLKIIATQEVKFLKENFEDNLKELNYLIRAHNIDDSNRSVDEKLEVLKNEVNRKSYIRMGIADLDGNAKTTDGKQFSIADRHYFKRVLTGKSVISEKLIDKVDHSSDIVVFSVPIFQGNEVKGVLFATELVTNLPKMIQPTFYQQQGNVYIIDSNGKIISTTNNFNIQAKENIFDYMDDKGENSKHILTDYMGNSKFKVKGENRYAAFSKIGLTTDWRILITIPKEIIMKHSNGVIQIASVFAIVNMMLLTLLFFIIFNIYVKFQKTKAEQEWLLRKSQIDPLSTIYNRATFEEKVLEEKGYVLLFIDIDDFKYYNNEFGHAVGDDVITFIGQTLNKVMNGRGFAGRVGGDEFVACIEKADLEFTKVVSEEILTHLEKGFYVKSIAKQLHVGCSIGISENQRNKYSYDILVKKADEAMYIAKKNGKGRYVII